MDGFIVDGISIKKQGIKLYLLRYLLRYCLQQIYILTILNNFH